MCTKLQKKRSRLNRKLKRHGYEKYVGEDSYGPRWSNLENFGSTCCKVSFAMFKIIFVRYVVIFWPIKVCAKKTLRALN